MENKILESLLNLDKPNLIPRGVVSVGTGSAQDSPNMIGYFILFRDPIDIPTLVKAIDNTPVTETPRRVNGTLSYKLEDHSKNGGQFFVYKVEKFPDGVGSETLPHRERYIISEIKPSLLSRKKQCIMITSFDSYPNELRLSPFASLIGLSYMKKPDELLCNFLETYRKMKYDRARLV